MEKRIGSYKVLFYSFGLLLIMSCQRELFLDQKLTEKMVVLNGVLVTDSLPITVSLCYVQAVGDTAKPKAIENATVGLYQNDVFVGNFLYTKNGIYEYNIAPLADNTYHIETTVGDKQVWAETKAPKKVQVTELVLDSIKSTHGDYYKNRFYITLNDGPEDNFYWLWIYSSDEYDEELRAYPNMIYSGSTYFDDYLASKDPGSGIPYIVSYSPMVRLTDVAFNGKSYRFDMVPIGGMGYVFEVNLNSFDEHYDKYYKSYLIYADYIGSSSIEEPPIYYQPSFIYSNVHNGTGIFGSMSCYSKTFTDTY